MFPHNRYYAGFYPRRPVPVPPEYPLQFGLEDNEDFYYDDGYADDEDDGYEDVGPILPWQLPPPRLDPRVHHPDRRIAGAPRRDLRPFHNRMPTDHARPPTNSTDNRRAEHPMFKFPPPNTPLAKPISLTDQDGFAAHYVHLVHMNPDPSAAGIRAAALERATQKRAQRAETDAPKLVENAMKNGVLNHLGESQYGSVWGISEGREDILAALEEVRRGAWKILGVGAGGSEGKLFLVRVLGLEAEQRDGRGTGRNHGGGFSTRGREDGIHPRDMRPEAVRRPARMLNERERVEFRRANGVYPPNLRERGMRRWR